MEEFRYSSLMVEGAAFIQVTIETKEPIELSDFIGAFASIGAEYERYMRQSNPDLAPQARIYVKQVRQGSIIIELVPLIAAFIDIADKVLIVDHFVQRYGGIIAAYKTANGRAENVNKSEIRDVMEGLTAIANDPDGRTDIQSIVIEGGKENVRAAITFTTPEARVAIDNMREHIRMIDHHEDEPHSMVLMRFFQSNLKDVPLEKRTTHRVIIESISPQDKPLVYGSDIAKDRITHEISEAEGNLYKKGFYVDVIVDMSEDKIAAYKVTNFHYIIDLPD
jgi:hypothetical protein